jgi:hypothetical protein
MKGRLSIRAPGIRRPCMHDTIIRSRCLAQGMAIIMHIADHKQDGEVGSGSVSGSTEACLPESAEERRARPLPK